MRFTESSHHFKDRRNDGQNYLHFDCTIVKVQITLLLYSLQCFKNQIAKVGSVLCNFVKKNVEKVL